MTGLTGVVDAAVVIGLAKGNVFSHLASLYTTLYIPTAAVQPVLDRMGRSGYGIAPALYERALRAAGEWPSP
jgi:hypothetical protein